MAQISQLLCRLGPDPVGDLPLSDRVNQLLDEQQIVWRDRLLPPLVTLRLFLIQIAHGNCARVCAAVLLFVGFFGFLFQGCVASGCMGQMRDVAWPVGTTKDAIRLEDGR